VIGLPFVRRHVTGTIAGGIGLLALGVLVMVLTLPRLLTTTPAAPTALDAPAATPADARRIQATLFYASADGRALRPVSREVGYGATPAEQARRIAEAQVGPAPEGHVSTIPAGTTVRAVYVTPRGEAYVDLSREIVTGHAGGSLNEALTVYALVNAITVNLPDVSSVQILVEGQEVDTLAGHLDLRQPIGRSLDWVQRGTP
jgi:spore germination protein GerM